MHNVGSASRTHTIQTTDGALVKWIVRHAAWLIPRFRGNDVQSPFYRAMRGPYRGMLLEFAECVLAHLPEVGKGSGNPAPKLADRWKFAVWLGKNDVTDEHLVRTDEGVVYARSVRRLAEHSLSEDKLRAVVETPQRPKTTTADIPPAAEPLALPHAPQEAPEDEKEEPTAEHEEDEEMQGGAGGHRRITRSVELRQRREAHRGTRECVREKTSDDEITMIP